MQVTGSYSSTPVSTGAMCPVWGTTLLKEDKLQEVESNKRFDVFGIIQFREEKTERDLINLIRIVLLCQIRD